MTTQQEAIAYAKQAETTLDLLIKMCPEFGKLDTTTAFLDSLDSLILVLGGRDDRPGQVRGH